MSYQGAFPLPDAVFHSNHKDAQAFFFDNLPGPQKQNAIKQAFLPSTCSLMSSFAKGFQVFCGAFWGDGSGGSVSVSLYFKAF